jgi:hypothetical protein
MHWFSNGVALLVAIGIIAIGIMYLTPTEGRDGELRPPASRTGC